MPPITHYRALLDAIAALPAVLPGHTRVFRGQTADYPRMLPSGLRRSLRKEAIWRVYAQHLYLDLVPDAFGEHDVTVDALQATALWLQAVAQHYGPGSKFVDVTYDLDSALWFALNDIERVEAHGVVGAPGPPDPVHDHPTRDVLFRYRPWTKPAYLYVWDLPVWDGEGTLAPGVVVDLARAPEIFASSPRMRAQHGCVVYCGEDAAGAFDLRALSTSDTLFEIARPLTGAPGIDRRVTDIFPSPAVDPWFERLLCVPMTYAATGSPPQLERSIPVTVYLDEDDRQYMDEVFACEIALRTSLLHRAIESNVPPTAIVLEAPMIFPYPTGDADQWHHGLLATDIPDRVCYHDLESGEVAGELTLDNVLFEFSLLERTGWEHVARGRVDMQMSRGLWLHRSAAGFAVAYLSHGVRGGDVAVQRFLPVHLDAATQRWMFGVPGTSETVPMADVPELAKMFFVALMLLRHLSPVLKPDVVPLITRRDGETMQSIVGCNRDAARLYRVASPVRDWYVLRDRHDREEPFAFVRQPDGGVQISGDTPFRDMSPEELRCGPE